MVILLGIALQIDRKNLNRAEVYVKDVKNMAQVQIVERVEGG